MRSFIILFALVFSTVLTTSAAAVENYHVHKRYLYVQPGQTIGGIIRVLYPNKQEQWSDIIQKTIKLNPHAFEHGDASRIRVGARIQLPDIQSKTTSRLAVYQGPEAVGQVVQSRGKTFAISSKKDKRDLKAGSEVFVGDRLFTGVEGFMQLKMIDDAKIDLRCNSEMLIEDYQLMRAGNRSIIYLIKGSLRKITGSIGKMAKDVYEMKTPMATVSVRGTEYAIRVEQSHGCDGSIDVNDKGMFVKVYKGAIDVINKSGSVSMAAGQAALVSSEIASPVGIKVSRGVFDSVGNDDKDSSNWWLWLLGIVVIVVAL